MLNPELLPFLDEWTRAWSALPSDATPQLRRQFLERIAADARLPTPDGVETNARMVRTRDRPVPIRIFRRNSERKQPALIYMHGGAWMQGSPETHWDITAALAGISRQTVISIDYALAPEFPFPHALNECREIIPWVWEKAEELGVDTSSISVGGDSACANLAAALAIAFRGSPYTFVGQLLIYPVVDFDLNRPSHSANAGGPLLTTAAMATANAAYCPDLGSRTNPLAAPYHAADHSGLPPAYVAAAEFDPLRDDAYDYAEKLRASGVDVTFDDGAGLIHGYLRAMSFSLTVMAKLHNMATWLTEVSRAR